MDFALSAEQEMFQTMFRNFASRELAPLAEEIDQEETLPEPLMHKAVTQGLLGATLPERYDGAGLDSLSYILLVEALAQACASFSVALATHVSLVATSILRHGDDLQKGKWLPAMAAGEIIGSFALTEPDSGSDFRALQTRADDALSARNGGQMDVIINGVKTWVANGAIAGLFLIFARGKHGVEAYLVPRSATGLTIGYREPTLGLRSVTFNTIYLEDCRVPATNRLGLAGEGLDIAQEARDEMAIALAAVALGVAEDSLAVAARYASERVQFGVPIACKQAIQGYIAETSVDVEALRYLVLRAAWLAGRGRDLSADASIAKAFGAGVARRASDKMLQVLGGYGYMEDFPLARKYRDARTLGIIGGPTELHHLNVAQRVLAPHGIEIAL